MATPTSTTFVPCDTTWRRTTPVVAPSAIRTPISRVRSATTYDNTPYNPTAPRMSARADTTPNVSMVNESCTIDRRARNSIVNSRYTGASGATLRTSARTSRISVAARGDFTTYAGDPMAHAPGAGPVSGKYTTASPASRQSSCFTSSTTPTTVNH